MNSQEVIQPIIDHFKTLQQVVAIALGGSSTDQQTDHLSDLDFYIYISADIPLEYRLKLAQNSASRMELNNQFWETGDEWIERNSGMHVDIMYRHKDWLEAELQSRMVQHQAAVGYTTCIWYNVLYSKVLYDPEGWLAKMQEKCQVTYPPKLQQAIIAKNFPILNSTISSYAAQISKAIKREDAISVNHRMAAFLASYFDILFAVNTLTHPGEKRLLEYALQHCCVLPTDMESDMEQLLHSKDPDTIKRQINRLADSLRQLLIVEGFLKSNKNSKI
jgi:hypothetical protein